MKIEYSGIASGVWLGKHTGHRYAFNKGRRENWVDKRDLNTLLSWRDPEGDQVFKSGS